MRPPILFTSFWGMRTRGWLFLSALVALKVIEYGVVHTRIDEQILFFYPLFFLVGLWLGHQLARFMARRFEWSLDWPRVTEAYLLTSLIQAPLSLWRTGQVLAGAEPLLPWAGMVLKVIQLTCFYYYVVHLHRPRSRANFSTGRLERP